MFQPFNKTKTYQDVIQNRINNEPTYNTNSAGMYRNPYFDLRTQQELAGELDPTATYPNPVFQPTVTESTPEDPYACPIGQTYDPVLGQCVDIVENNDDDNENPELPYQGVGTVFSPEQNAFANLGLGAEGLTADTAKSYYGSGEINPYGTGLGGLIKRFTPLGQYSVFRDVNTLVNAGVLNKANDGTLTFAKGGNLALAQANQKFEQDLARKQGLNLDAKAENPYEDQYGNEIYMVQSRGDKADDMGDVYKNLQGVSSQPFQSNYGATTIKSYSNNSGDTSGGRSMQNFNRRQEQKKYQNTAQTGAKSGYRYGL